MLIQRKSQFCFLFFHARLGYWQAKRWRLMCRLLDSFGWRLESEIICASVTFILTAQLIKSSAWCCVLRSLSLFRSLCFYLYAGEFLFWVSCAYQALEPASSWSRCFRVGKGPAGFELQLPISLFAVLGCVCASLCMNDGGKSIHVYITQIVLGAWCNGDAQPLIRHWLIASKPVI